MLYISPTNTVRVQCNRSRRVVLFCQRRITIFTHRESYRMIYNIMTVKERIYYIGISARRYREKEKRIYKDRTCVYTNSI